VGLWFFIFHSEFSFPTTRELEYFFFWSRKARILFPEFNIRLYDKHSESHFFFLHQDQNIFVSNIGNQNTFLEKNHNSPWKLNGPSLKICISRQTLLLCIYWVTRFIWGVKFLSFDKCLLWRVWRYQRGNQKPYIEVKQTTQWPLTKI
jgi:hypothetical protein